ncbi:MAG: glycosyltransferase [Lachnospiraceae bacterium]|nr:glycosyltransferase [Lachnospiraceae bacterium]
MKVSIAMTTYNGEKYILSLLESVKSQIVLPDEVIIYDDCSTDNTFELVSEYISRNNLLNWKAKKNKCNIGWKKNFRQALKDCNHELIFLCDQDDIWENYKISEMKQVMEIHPEIQLLTSNYTPLDIDRKDKVRVWGLNRNDATIRKLGFGYTAFSVARPGCTYCCTKRLVDEMLNRDYLNAPHDAILWGYAVLNQSVYLYNRKTIIFKRHSDSATAPRHCFSSSSRIEHINLEFSIKCFFKKQCLLLGDNSKAKIIEEQIRFDQSRITMLKKKSVLLMMIFQIVHFKHYPSLRNLLSDDYLMLLKR